VKAFLQQVHRSFIRGGSQAICTITTNSYAITPNVGFSDDELYRYASEARRLARECAVEATRDILVMGSLPPLQESYRSDLILPHSEGFRYYTILVQALAPHVDCFLAETMSCYDGSQTSSSLPAPAAVINRASQSRSCAASKWKSQIFAPTPCETNSTSSLKHLTISE
jgi:methionine synthase I (cobalamin-dependent)